MGLAVHPYLEKFIKDATSLAYDSGSECTFTVLTQVQTCVDHAQDPCGKLRKAANNMLIETFIGEDGPVQVSRTRLGVWFVLTEKDEPSMRVDLWHLDPYSVAEVSERKLFRTTTAADEFVRMYERMVLDLVRQGAFKNKKNPTAE